MIDEDHNEDWVGDVIRSPLDDRVWCVILPDVDVMSGALHASTSLRKCKAYAAGQIAHDLDVKPSDIVWTHEPNGDWRATLPYQEGRP